MDFTSKICQVPLKRKKTLYLKLRKRLTRGIAVRNICTNLEACLNIFKLRNDDTYSVINQKVAKSHKSKKISINSKNTHYR